MSNITVEKMVETWLRANGYDGLYSDDCGCEVDDLMPCGETTMTCQAGYKVPCPGPEECDEGGLCPWHIGPNKYIPQVQEKL